MDQTRKKKIKEHKRKIFLNMVSVIHCSYLHSGVSSGSSFVIDLMLWKCGESSQLTAETDSAPCINRNSLPCLQPLIATVQTLTPMDSSIVMTHCTVPPFLSFQIWPTNLPMKLLTIQTLSSFPAVELIYDETETYSHEIQNEGISLWSLQIFPGNIVQWKQYRSLNVFNFFFCLIKFR